MRGFVVGRLLDTFRKEASSVPALQHSCQIVSLATFQPTECLIGPALYFARLINERRETMKKSYLVVAAAGLLLGLGVSARRTDDSIRLREPGRPQWL